MSNTPGGAGALAGAMKVPATNVTSASFDAVPPSFTPHGTANAPLSSFPTAGPTFSILTTGMVQFADDPNTAPNTGFDLNGGSATDGPHTRGDTDYDVTVLKVNVDVPATANCLTIDFQFYSDEFPEWVNTAYNDAFIAELDASTWDTAGTNITAPDNFAFDPSGEVISINSSGNTSMNVANAAGTTYDGATPLLQASHEVTPGAHSLYLSIFDQGDQIFDSATFLDNLVVGFVANPSVNCVPGAQPKLYDLGLSPASAENPVGTSHTVTATLTDEDSAPVANEAVEFDVTGANSASGSATTNASGQATFSYTGSNAGNDGISACYDADNDGACEATGSATKTWKQYGLTLTPASANNPVGTAHTVTARLTDGEGDPVANEALGFAAAGANSASGSATTNANGEATFTYSGSNAGDDAISACWDADGDADCEASGSATKRWTQYSLALTPASASNPVGTDHTVTARLTNGGGNPVANESVEFDVTGANSGSGSATTNANGEATFTYPGSNAGDDTISACWNADADPACEASGSATKHWSQYGLTVTPASASNPVGTDHTVTARLTNGGGNPVANESVDFDVTGANSGSGSATTNANGEATFTYSGTQTGDDTISACWNADADPACEASGSATKHWNSYDLTLTPASAENLVGTNHTVTATLTDESGGAVSGADVDFGVTGVNTASGSSATTASGQATFTYTGTNAGNDAISACFDLNNDGTCEASASATKRWKQYALTLTPASAENPVGSPHTVTATLTDETSSSVPGADVDFSVSGANTASGSSPTNASGQATFTYTGTNAGDDAIAACFDANNDGTCEATASATKRWIAPEPPSCEVTATPDELWPPNHKFRLVKLSGPDVAEVHITTVTQDEPLDGSGDGSTWPDAKRAHDSDEVYIRAERQGSGDGRVYEISYEVECCDGDDDGLDRRTGGGHDDDECCDDGDDRLIPGKKGGGGDDCECDDHDRLVPGKYGGRGDDDCECDDDDRLVPRKYGGRGDDCDDDDDRRLARSGGHGDDCDDDDNCLEGSVTVGVPHDQSGGPAIDSGQTVNSFGSW